MTVFEPKTRYMLLRGGMLLPVYSTRAYEEEGSYANPEEVLGHGYVKDAA